MTIADQLRRDEGVRNFPYVDTVGKITIGIGRNLTDLGISENGIQLFYQEDFDRINNQVQARLPYFQALDPVRQGVLINMAFNMGFNGLEKFQNMLTAFAKGDWEVAASEMMNSAWAGQVKDRATRLAQQTRTGIWT
jgi:lysozyme